MIDEARAGGRVSGYFVATTIVALVVWEVVSRVYPELAFLWGKPSEVIGSVPSLIGKKSTLEDFFGPAAQRMLVCSSVRCSEPLWRW